MLQASYIIKNVSVSEWNNCYPYLPKNKESVHKTKLWNMNFWVDSTTTNVNRAWKWNSTCLVTFHCQKTILRCPATCANADQQWKDIETKLTKSTATLTAPHCTCIPDQQADFSSLTHLPSVFSTLVRDTAQNSQPWNKHGNSHEPMKYTRKQE